MPACDARSTFVLRQTSALSRSVMPLLPSQSFLLFGMLEDALSRGGKEFTKLVRLQTAHPNEYDGVRDVVIRQVKRFRIVREECGALFEIGADHKGPWLR